MFVHIFPRRLVWSITRMYLDTYIFNSFWNRMYSEVPELAFILVLWPVLGWIFHYQAAAVIHFLSKNGEKRVYARDPKYALPSLNPNYSYG